MEQPLQLLGGPKLFADGTWTRPPVNRPLLLLSYLAFQETWVSRDRLLVLFWPEARESKARQSLRALLYSCKNEAYGRTLETEKTRIRCLVKTDVHGFQEAISKGEWQTALGSYRGAFLERVQGDDSATFEAWLEQTRDDLHVAWRDAALRGAEALSEKGRYDEAAHLLQKVLHYDFLAEDVVQACMRAQARAGRKAQALKTFERFSKQLGRELEMKPLEATLKLAATLRHAEGDVENPAAARTTKSFTQPLTLPQPLTPFVGRKLELLELSNLLAQPHNRFITLLGPGGMGKSRLSLQLLEDQAKHFGDGVAFVSLAALSSAADLPSAVASALKLELTGKSSVAEEVLGYLQDKTMLIVLDNFEHLLGGGTFAQQLMAAAPRCKYIGTSRVLLGIANEVVYDVSGLTLPFSGEDTQLEAYDAAQLFVRSARRIRSDFSLQKRDYAALFELCKILDGMPLALELAASWVRLFSLEELVEELRRDVDLLETTSRQVSERHRSLRKVFEQSWHFLSPEEQRVLAALAVFQGGFDRQAARTVARASARTLLALVNKSLLRSTASGRFSILVVIAQYAAEKLAQNAAEVKQHGLYYLNLLANASEELKGSSPQSVLTGLEQDLENLRAAWHWALGAERVDLCLRVLEPLRVFFTARAHLQEGIAFLEPALSILRGKSESGFTASIRIELAYFFRRLDRQQEANLHAREALQVAQSVAGAEHLTVTSLCELAITGCWLGNFEESACYAERALTLAEALHSPDLIVTCKSRLALAKRYLGAFDEARQLYEAVLDYERRLGRQLDMLRTLSDLGRLYVDMNTPHTARVLFREGLELAESHNVPYDLGFMWEGLSQCSYLLGDYDQARLQAETALRCSEAVHDSMGVAVQCAELAKTHVALGQLEQAETYLRRGLKIAWAKQEVPEVMRLFTAWAQVFVRRQAFGRAATLLVWVTEHPGSQAIHKQQARELLDSLTVEVLTVEGAEPSSGSLADTVNTLLGQAR